MKKNRKWIILIGVVFVYILFQVIPYGKNHVSTPFKIDPGSRPLVIAHGGAKLMNPENTVMSFTYAYDLGVDVLEMDLRLTSDGELITYHNEDLGDFSDLVGNPSDYTYDEIKNYNFGVNFEDLNGDYPYRDLTNEELLAFEGALAPANVENLFKEYRDSILYICEIKDDGEQGIRAAEKLLQLIQKYNLENVVCVASFNKEPLAYFRDLAPEIVVTSFDMSSATDFIIANYAGYGLFKNYSHSGFQLPLSEYGIPLNTSYLIYKIHKNDMFVHYWTINKVQDMKKCIKNGADGIITDRPDLLIQLLDEMGY